MNKEDFKFRYYNGEEECPVTEPENYDKESLMFRSFWDVERYVSKSFTKEKILARFKERFVKGSPFYSEILDKMDIPESEKAVFVTCCSVVDCNHPGIDQTLIDGYFKHGYPHVVDLLKEENQDS